MRPVSDEVSPFSAARRSAKPATNVFVSPRSFGRGCAAMANIRARESHRIERICASWALAGEISGSGYIHCAEVMLKSRMLRT